VVVVWQRRSLPPWFSWQGVRFVRVWPWVRSPYGGALCACLALWPARLGREVGLVPFGGHGARSVAVSYKPSMLVTRVRLPACASSPDGWACDRLWLFRVALGGCGNSPHWGLNPGPSVYKTDALPLSYRGVAFRRGGGIEPLHVSMPRELKSRPGTSPTHPGCSRAAPMRAVLVSCLVGLRLRCESDSEGIRTPAGRAQWISSPSP
jgi:hypothetical protein